MAPGPSTAGSQRRSVAPTELFLEKCMPGFFPAVSRTVDPTSRRARRCVRLCLEYLEHRDLLSVSYAPAQVVHAYGFDQQTLTGSGQTIAIVDAYDNPNIASDLAAFDTKFG